MVAFNLLLSLLPFALVALFVASRVLRSGAIETSVLRDLMRLFPTAATSTITGALTRVRAESTNLGIVALLTSVWFGSSFWGALDTAFCSIYRVRCRSWPEQKRFGIVMLVVVIALMAATVAVPAAQSILVKGASDLPFGLAKLPGIAYAITLAGGLLLLFAILCIVYWAVPNARIPWRAIWPGAVVATVAIGVVDYSFPLYLSNISTIAQLGTTLVFVIIVLLWFYALALIILAGGVVNALRYGVASGRQA
ncbi:MAG: hypothetical protein NVSMB25_05660 [Thermoleophilaceae bacterium]